MSISPEASRMRITPPILTGVGKVDRGSTAYLCPTEALDLVGARTLIERARPVMLNCQRLLVDLQEIDFIDSSGVRALLYLATQLEEGGKELRLVVRRGSRVERTLNILRLLGRFQADCRPEGASARPGPVSA